MPPGFGFASRVAIPPAPPVIMSPTPDIGFDNADPPVGNCHDGRTPVPLVVRTYPMLPAPAVIAWNGPVAVVPPASTAYAVTAVPPVPPPVTGMTPWISAAAIVPHGGVAAVPPLPVWVRNCFAAVVFPGTRSAAPAAVPAIMSPGLVIGLENPAGLACHVGVVPGPFDVRTWADPPMLSAAAVPPATPTIMSPKAAIGFWNPAGLACHTGSDPAPCDVRTCPAVPAVATCCTALVELVPPVSTRYAFSAPAPRPPLVTGKIPDTSAVTTDPHAGVPAVPPLPVWVRNFFAVPVFPGTRIAVPDTVPAIMSPAVVIGFENPGPAPHTGSDPAPWLVSTCPDVPRPGICCNAVGDVPPATSAYAVRAVPPMTTAEFRYPAVVTW